MALTWSLSVALAACAAPGDAVNSSQPQDGASPSGVASAGDDGPGARSTAELVYDPNRQQVLMINGSTGSNSSDAGRPGVLWAFDGERWTAIADDGPPGRSVGGVAYDVARGVLVVAGGRQGDVPVTDTWEWDGAEWSDQGVPMPGGTSNHLAAAYDAARGETVVVFGQDAAGELSNATLGWDGTTWRELYRGGPPTRAHYAIGYYPGRQVVVMFGGHDPIGGRDLGDTWEWDGAQWAEVAVEGPTPRAGARMAYDAAAGAMVLFGGSNGRSRYYSDTWQWDGASWELLAEIGPSARGYGGMAYDAARSRIVMYGGYDRSDLGDTWEWAGGRWTQVSPGA